MKINFYTFYASVVLALMLFTPVSFGQTYTFTNGTATGNVGPDQTMMDAEYMGTTLEGDVEVIGGIQYWVVPSTGGYSIEAYGGQGYGDFGGRGAYIYGEFNLTAGDTLKILVGQEAGHYLNYPSTTYNHQFGGGGGSFITMYDNTPLVVAGGGGGNHGTSFLASCDGQVGTAGADGANASGIGLGGTGGMGGQQATSADGGGGLLGDGNGTAGGQAFVNGGLGGIDEGTGGFGCGGGTSSWNNYRGGGGGGYSGGGGANNSGTCCPAGGGGGSYNAGVNQNSIAGAQTGHGLVVISNLCTSTTMTPDSTSLTDITSECSVAMPSAPTASNDCGQTITGVPDVAFPITDGGTTIVTWTFDDGSTTATQTQNVIINDVTGPTPDMASLPDSTYWCSVDALIAPTATDNCSDTVFVTNDVTLPITTGGLTVVTWTYTDTSGNTSTQTQNITLNVIDNGVTVNGDMIYADMPGYTYQWLDCDNGYAEITGENNQFYNPTSTGNYAVEVTENGCVDTSACMSVDVSKIEEVEISNLVIYPNPTTSGQFFVKADDIIQKVQLFDALGREVYVEYNMNTGEVDASSLASGKYIVRVATDKSMNSKIVVITQ